ncbi:NADPH-dependent FMN reductase [Phyllobacterium myrsinacearum]|uniref:FMN reductase n=1 Tax=Phyllobacterium myrsinacearum TaxID=28101 RepID=A0A2S9JJD5_9HYPH|nr:NAD(P)H-dependent oxidoreductase [Phyllobacterium myrsinacearum]PRD53075.1 FMN reductase [Phyllobacterium myrsinacearum]PWV94081.1 NAD(P)H-dependent FMN reductase [Phyllobacterium myrsinacearum]RZV07480.1 NAD(P)H-dependent FMN reductase [Phyllobacterium myrsinacearum]
MLPKILVFAGSNRTGAFSGQVADVATRTLAALGAEVTRIALIDYPLPIMDQDLEKEKGIPENAVKLGRLFAAHDGILIASPEYNSSIPPLLKNTIDWVSRISRDGEKPLRPYAGKIVALCSSSDGNFAGIRGLYHLRSVLMNVGTQIISEQCSVAHAHEAFADDGSFHDERTTRAMERVCQALIDHTRLAKSR